MPLSTVLLPCCPSYPFLEGGGSIFWHTSKQLARAHSSIFLTKLHSPPSWSSVSGPLTLVSSHPVFDLSYHTLLRTELFRLRGAFPHLHYPLGPFSVSARLLSTQRLDGVSHGKLPEYIVFRRTPQIPMLKLYEA
ncbi:hypothetical protein CGRA01v4_01827 [Colletotrichum graminicola]|nr:hypothetical protein CGRA01v4_01827 [Colletotrichum graminicola]